VREPRPVLSWHDAHQLLLDFLRRQDDPVKIEQELMGIVPREDWTWFSHTLIQHGRQVCIARRPRCADCVLNRLCPSSTV